VGLTVGVGLGGVVGAEVGVSVGDGVFVGAGVPSTRVHPAARLIMANRSPQLRVVIQNRRFILILLSDWRSYYIGSYLIIKVKDT
jgi:hypothetical protein